MGRSAAIAVTALFIAMTGTSNAALIERDIQGTVTSVNGASNIAVGNTISGQVSYDDSDIGDFKTTPTDSLEFVFPGGLVLTGADDPFGAGSIFDNSKEFNKFFLA